MPTSRREFGWDNADESQKLRVQVSNWDYKVFVVPFQSHRTLFQFKGVVVRESGLAGLQVDGDIRINYEILYPDEEEPSDNLGTLDFSLERGARGADSFVGVTLEVAPETFAELFRVFSATFGSNGELDLELRLKHPKWAEPDFWRSGWQKEDIQIVRFGFYSGGEIGAKLEG